MSEFWADKAVKWENRRYDSWLSDKLYSSLRYRMDFLIYVIGQLPPGSRVVELGCGSGRLFEMLPNKNNLSYAGYDISQVAIEKARQSHQGFPNAEWICADVFEIAAKPADLVVSAGLLDWLNDKKILQVAMLFKGVPFIHSFSREQLGLKTSLHRAFSFYQSLTQKISYRPRKFSSVQIQKLLGEHVSFITHSDLSFGAFVVFGLKASYAEFKNREYFSPKKSSVGFIEGYFKKTEALAVRPYLSDLTGLNVLEVGSGAGYYTKLLLSAKVQQLTSIDPHVKTSEFITAPQMNFFSTDLASYVSDSKYDLVVAIGVIEFAENADLFIGRLKELLLPNGKILLTCPKENGVVAFMYRHFHRKLGVTSLTQRDLQGLFRKHGLVVQHRFAHGLLNQGYELKAEHE